MASGLCVHPSITGIDSLRWVKLLPGLKRIPCLADRRSLPQAARGVNGSCNNSLEGNLERAVGWKNFPLHSYFLSDLGSIRYHSSAEFLLEKSGLL